MNILFYTTNEVAPQYGGVERVTAKNPLLNSNSLIQLKSILITISII